VDRRKIRVFKQRDKVCLGSLLQRHDGRRLESEVRLEVLSDLTDKSLEGQLPDQEFRRLLVPADLSQGHGTRAEPVRLLHTTSCLYTKLETSRREKHKEGTRTVGCLRAAEDLAASCFLGALPPVDLRAVCFVRAIDESGCWFWLVVW